MTTQIDTMAVQALLDGTVEQLAFSDYFTYPLDGDEAVLMDDQRLEIEKALGCKLKEVPVTQQGATMLTRLGIPEEFQAKAQALVDNA